MAKKLDNFRRVTKINQKEKVGIFSSGLFIFLVPGLLAFLVIVWTTQNIWIGLLIGLFLLCVLLISGGIEPYRYIRALINSPSKHRWVWGRRPAKSIFKKNDNTR